MAGRNYGYYSNHHNYNSSPSPYSFGSNYISGPSYHHVTAPSTRNLFSLLPTSYGSSTIRDFPRPTSFGVIPKVSPVAYRPSPVRIIKSSNFILPSISESHAVITRATPPPPYRPLVVSSRLNVRDTANIDVVNRPASKKINNNPPEDRSKESFVPSGGVIQRDFTVGTLKRGRKVIRLQTTRLPSPDRPPPEVPVIKIKEEEPKPTATVTRPPIKPYGANNNVKKTPGERMKEKFLLPSRKGAKKFPVSQRPDPAIFSQDSGLGSSPIITAPTSFRDPKIDEQSSSSIVEVILRD